MSNVIEFKKKTKKKTKYSSLTVDNREEVLQSIKNEIANRIGKMTKGV